MRRKNDHALATRALAVGRMEGVIASVDHGGVLSLVSREGYGTSVQVVAADGEAGRFELVMETLSQRHVLARGGLGEMVALRDHMAEDVGRALVRLRGSRFRGGAALSMLAGAVLGAVATIAIMPVPVIPPGGAPGPSAPALPRGFPQLPQLPQGMGGPRPPAPAVPANPASGVPAAPVAPAAAAAAGFPLGAVSRPAVPVSLDDDPVADANAPAAAPATGAAPVPPAAAPVVVPTPAAPPVPPPAPAQLTPPPAAPAPVPVPAPAPQPAPGPGAAAPAPADAPAVAAAPEAAPAAQAPRVAAAPRAPVVTDAQRRSLLALGQVRQRLVSGQKVPREMLADLPPGVAEQIEAAGALEPSQGETLPPDALRNNRDRLGIPTVPDRLSWAGTTGPTIPLPGGGDIQSADDLRSFGLDPGGQRFDLPNQP